MPRRAVGVDGTRNGWVAIVAWTAAGLHHPAGLRCHPDPPEEWDRGRPIAIWARP